MTIPASDDIHIRLPRKLKRDAQKVIERNGLDVTSAIRLFFTHMTIRGTIPLPWLTVNGLSPELEESLLKQMRNPDIAATLKSSEDIDKLIDGL